MTIHDRTPADLDAVLTTTTHVLLDFDGPVCSIFAGLPAPTIAAELRALMTAHGVDIPPPVRDQAGPHELLQFAGTVSRDLAHQVETALREAELTAAATAEPTPGADHFLAACHDTGRPVAIVSNNPHDAIATYLARHGLTRYVDHIEGRDPTDPARMKPSPHLVTRAIDALTATPSACVLIGDATTDIHAAHAAGTLAIGYANKPGKRQRLTQAGADAITDTMTTLTNHLRALNQTDRQHR